MNNSHQQSPPNIKPKDEQTSGWLVPTRGQITRPSSLIAVSKQNGDEYAHGIPSNLEDSLSEHDTDGSFGHLERTDIREEDAQLIASVGLENWKGEV